jgi:hypothetical protein
LVTDRKVISFGEAKQLFNLVRLGFPPNLLKIEEFADIRVGINMVTSAYSGQVKSESEREGANLLKPKVCRRGQCFLK